MEQPCGILNERYEQDMAIIRTKTQWGLLIAFLIFLFCLPLFADSKLLGLMISIGITLIAVLGLNLLTGYCGQISLGQAGFMAAGGFISGMVTLNLGFPFLAALICGGLGGGLVGLLFGLPSLRLKGFYLLMATLAAQFIIVYAIIHGPVGITGGSYGLGLPTAQIGGIIFDSSQSYYYLVMAVVVIMIAFSRNLVRTRVGRAFIAIRDNDLAAKVMGVNVFLYKLLAFFICCFFAGIAGTLQVFYVEYATVEAFTLMDSIWYIGMLIVGGMGSTMGAIFGTVFIRVLEYGVTMLNPYLTAIFAGSADVTASALHIAYGAIILLFLILEPRGLNHRWELFKSYYRLHPFNY